MSYTITLHDLPKPILIQIVANAPLEMVRLIDSKCKEYVEELLRTVNIEVTSKFKDVSMRENSNLSQAVLFKKVIMDLYCKAKKLEQGREISKIEKKPSDFRTYQNLTRQVKKRDDQPHFSLINIFKKFKTPVSKPSETKSHNSNLNNSMDCNRITWEFENYKNLVSYIKELETMPVKEKSCACPCPPQIYEDMRNFSHVYEHQNWMWMSGFSNTRKPSYDATTSMWTQVSNTSEFRYD